MEHGPLTLKKSYGKQKGIDVEFWKTEPKFFIPLHTTTLVKGEELYKWQMNHLGSALLLEDRISPVEIESCSANAHASFTFPLGSLISGSFAMHYVIKNMGYGLGVVQYDDIDVYFKSKVDAESFAKKYHMYASFDNPMCAYVNCNGNKFNLIYGVEYNTPGDLISRFDIRACSMAIDPNNDVLHIVKGAIEDATNRRITFNPVPRGVSIRRLAKYIKKNFTIDGHQSLFFAELVRSDIYSPELELMTKNY